MLVPYKVDLWTRAAERAASMPVYDGSHRGVQANEVGALGEVMFEEFLVSKSISFTPSYRTTDDLVVQGATVDVKTKDRTVEPKPHYECSVPLYNHEHQRPDLYVFVSLVRGRPLNNQSISRFTHGHIVGWATLPEVDNGKLWNAGDTDAANGTTFWTACRNLRISDLRTMDALIASCRNGSISKLRQAP